MYISIIIKREAQFLGG